jgi:hypothetical protein
MSVSQNFPSISPSLSINFARSKTLDPRIAFTRSSSATRVNSQGLVETVPADTPRFDHAYNSSTDTVESLGLLIEESRTNLFTYSEDLNNAIWNKSNLNVSTNVAISPDGTNTANLVVPNTATSLHRFIPSISVPLTPITISLFAKSDGIHSFIMMRGDNQTNYVYFNVLLGVLGPVSTDNSTSASITAYPNGWYKCSMTYTPAATTNDPEIYLVDTDTRGASNWTGGGVNGVYMWGLQLEVGSFPTSYIPTVASTVTRSDDDVSMSGTNFSSWYNQGQGTLIGKLKKISSGVGFGYEIATFQTSSPNRLIINQNLTEDISCSISDSTGTGATTVTLLSAAPLNTNYTIGLAYSPNNSAVCYNGNTPIAETIEGATGTLLRLKFGRTSTVYTSVGSGWLSWFTYYPIRLTNSQLQNLTK